MLFYLPVKTPRGDAAGYLRAEGGVAAVTLRRMFSGELCVLAGDRVLPASPGVPFPFPTDFVAVAGIENGALAFYAAEPAQNMTPTRLLYALSRRAPAHTPSPVSASAPVTAPAPAPSKDVLSSLQQSDVPAPVSAPAPVACQASSAPPASRQEPDDMSAVDKAAPPSPAFIDDVPVSAPVASPPSSASAENVAASARAHLEPESPQDATARPVRVSKRSRSVPDTAAAFSPSAIPDIFDTAADTRSFAATLRHACRVYAEALEEEQQPFTPPAFAQPSDPAPARSASDARRPPGDKDASAPAPRRPRTARVDAFSDCFFVPSDDGAADGAPPFDIAGEQDVAERPIPPYATRENRWMDEVNTLLFSTDALPRGR